MNKYHIPFFRLNTESLVTDYDFSFEFHNGKELSFYIKDRDNGKEIKDDEILSVWYRRPRNPDSLPFSTDEQIDQHNLEEAKGFFSYLMHFLNNYYCIGNHLYDKVAGSKLVQLQLATELGMEIPDTCFTNTKKDLMDFSSDYESIILKPIKNYGVYYSDDENYPFFTTRIATSSLATNEEDAFRQTVNFCENYIEKSYELRVTVMGNHTFACKIDSQHQDENTGKIDWRQGYDHGLKHEIIDLPERINQFCREYLRRMHLNFGCFDFIVTSEGKYVFLECNPNGQWVWIEEETHAPMSEAMLDCLVNKPKV